MNGKEIFEKYINVANPSASEKDYINTLRTAFMIDSEKLFRLLEVAEKSGKKVNLSYPIPIEEGSSEPDGITLT